jgi:hypothetical protein
MTSSLPSDRPIWHNTVSGQTTPTNTPLGRRERIRDAQAHGEWQRVASLLHEAHTNQEWLGCGLSSWSAYVETIPMSRMHDWRLRLIARSGTARVGYSYRAAYREAKSQ